MTCSTTATFKRGTSFAATVTYTPDVGGPSNLLGYTVASTIRDAQSNEYDLVIVVAVDGLSFTATYAGDTGDWAIGAAKWDIKFSSGSTVFYSDTMRLDVIAQVTV